MPAGTWDRWGTSVDQFKGPRLGAAAGAKPRGDCGCHVLGFGAAELEGFHCQRNLASKSLSQVLRKVSYMEFTIDCRACPRHQEEACDDCVVTFVASRCPDEAVVVDAGEFAALRRLAAAGLISSPLDAHQRPSKRLRQAG